MPPPCPPEPLPPPPPLGGIKPSASVALPLNATVTILKHATCSPAQTPHHWVLGAAALCRAGSNGRPIVVDDKVMSYPLQSSALETNS